MSVDLASTVISSPVGAAGQRVPLAASATALSPVELLHLSELARSDAPFARIQQQMVVAARRWVAAESVSLFVADAGGKPDEVHSNCLNLSPNSRLLTRYSRLLTRYWHWSLRLLRIAVCAHARWSQNQRQLRNHWVRSRLMKVFNMTAHSDSFRPNDRTELVFVLLTQLCAQVGSPAIFLGRDARRH
jgi:hypothetical protein